MCLVQAKTCEIVFPTKEVGQGGGIQIFISEEVCQYHSGSQGPEHCTNAQWGGKRSCDVM